MLLVCFLFRLHSSADVVAATVGFSEAVDFGKSSDKQHNYGVDPWGDIVLGSHAVFCCRCRQHFCGLDLGT